MTERLPPLTALRAFDAAARHMSFAKAAAELNVTPAALSFQIKSLEAQLGQPVFTRLNRAVALTEAGKALAPGTADGFQALAAAWTAARQRRDATFLSVTAGPGFTARWLAPRIFEFARDHPEIELRFVASLKLLDFQRDGIDVAIRFGAGPDEGLYVRPLLRDWITPMVAPSIAETLKHPADLANVPLFPLTDTDQFTPPLGWETWFAAQGLETPPVSGPLFSQHDHALDAAAGGAGAVMGRIALAAGDLDRGQLVAPFPLALRSRSQYRFLCRPTEEQRPEIQAFEAWIVAQLAQTSKFDAEREFLDLA